MSDRNRIPDFFEEAEDTLFQKLIDRQEGASALEEIKANHSEPSEEEIAAFRRKLDKLSSEDPPLHPTPAKGTKLRRMVLVAAIIIVLLVTAAAAFHKEVFNWIEKTHERFTLFQAVDQTENTIRTWMGYYAPTALPEEYFVSDAVEGETARIIEYANANNDRILFYQYTSEAYFTLDTEDATASQPCQLGEITARHFEKGNKSTLYWFNGDRAYSIEFNSDSLSFDAVERMAESLSPIS